MASAFPKKSSAAKTAWRSWPTPKRKIVARAEERYRREKAEYDGKMARRAAKEIESGKKLGGKPLKEPEPGPKASDQINLTDEESRIMPVSGGGFE